MKNFKTSLFVLLFCIFISSCQPIATSNSICQKGNLGELENEINTVVDSLDSRTGDGLHIQKVDNLLILIDDSIRLLECQDGKFLREKAFDLVSKIDASLVDTRLNTGIRIFGPHADRNSFNSSNLYCLADSQSSNLKQSIITITPENPMLNPVAMALESAYQELKNIDGNTAILLLSDFDKIDSDVYDVASRISQYYKDRVCFYGIYLGDEKGHVDYLNKIIGLDSGCGIFTKETVLNEPSVLTDFLETVIYEIVEPAQETVVAANVIEEKAEPVVKIVPDSSSAKIEHKTPPVPELSYEKLQIEKELRVELKTEFDLGKSVIKPLYLSHLEAVAQFMKKYSETTTVIEGHTCDIGTKEYNLKLSQKRADAIKHYLVDTYGIASNRIQTKAFGESQPIAENTTDEGRQKNRRAEAVITAKVAEEVETTQEVKDPILTMSQKDRFVLIDAMTVLDTKTDLMWGTMDNGTDIDWIDAKKFCESFTGGGFSDWRMATQKELETIYLPGEKSSAGYFVPKHINLTDCCVWSSDVSMGSSGIFSFKTGNRPWGYQHDSYQLRALPVRSTKKVD